MTTAADLLAQAPIFRLLDAEERTALAAVLGEVSFAAGATVFAAGEPGDRMYVVGAGTVELSVADKLGQKIVLAEAGPGDIFGELSLLDQGPRTATAVALEPVQLMVLDRPALTRFLATKPEAALDMMAVMAKRIRETDERLRQGAARNVNVEMARRNTVIEHVTDTIAAFSGSVHFLALHAVLFAGWIGWNTWPGLAAFDPYPFGLLTMWVSLEAIFLSVVVLLSQNREAAKDRVRSDIEYDVNVKAELEVSSLHDKVDRLHEAMLARLGSLENRLKP
jgi:uncharacterized membrane protein